MLRIALDITSALKRAPTGIGVYARELYLALRAHPQHQSGAFELLACRKASRRWFAQAPDGAPVRPFLGGVPGRVANEILLGPHDIFHHTKNKVESHGRARVVVTLHDTFDLHFDIASLSPKLAHTVDRKYRKLAGGSDRIVVVSNFTRDELLRRLPGLAERVRTVYLGLDARIAPASAEAVQALRRRFNIDRPYLLFTGSLCQRKNLPRMLDVFGRWWERHRDFLLVLAGGMGADLADSLPARLADPRLAPGLRVLGYVADEDLPALYTGALALFFPSLCEGFGLPNIEAMACGTPVLSSRSSAIPEICGDAALLVDPYQDDDILQGLERMVGDGELRRQLAARGLAQAARYSWARAADEVLAVYRELGPGCA